MVKKYVLKEEGDIDSLGQQLQGIAKKREKQQAAQAAAGRPVLPEWTQSILAKGIFLGGVFVLALVICIGVVIPGFGRLFANFRMQTVPNVVGLKRDEANTTLNNLGLRVKVEYATVSDKPEGTVLGVNPPAGTRVPQNAEIIVKVSLKKKRVVANAGGPKLNPTPNPLPGPNPGPDPAPQPNPADKKVAVPDVEGMVLAKAQAQVEKLGLKVTTVEKRDPGQPDKIVLTCVPRPGTLLGPGAAVTFTVNKLSAQDVVKGDLIQIKNYAGMDGQTAINQLWGLGFKVTFAQQASADQSPGYVIRTEPPAGSMLPPGSDVRVIVAQ